MRKSIVLPSCPSHHIHVPLMSRRTTSSLDEGLLSTNSLLSLRMVSSFLGLPPPSTPPSMTGSSLDKRSPILPQQTTVSFLNEWSPPLMNGRLPRQMAPSLGEHSLSRRMAPSVYECSPLATNGLPPPSMTGPSRNECSPPSANCSSLGPSTNSPFLDERSPPTNILLMNVLLPKRTPPLLMNILLPR